MARHTNLALRKYPLFIGLFGHLREATLVCSAINKKPSSVILISESRFFVDGDFVHPAISLIRRSSEPVILCFFYLFLSCLSCSTAILSILLFLLDPALV